MKRSPNQTRVRSVLVALAVVLILLGAGALPAFAHCDTADGPVVTEARKALDAGDVTPVLKWVKPEAEPEIRAAFAKTLAVRGASPEARELADTWFLETLVRLHRAGEGAPYTGLKPAGGFVEPGIAAADHALESGSIDPLVDHLKAAVEASVRESFHRLTEAARAKDTSVDAGREFVEAYVRFIHSVERFHQAAARDEPDHQMHAEG